MCVSCPDEAGTKGQNGSISAMDCHYVSHDEDVLARVIKVIFKTVGFLCVVVILVYLLYRCLKALRDNENELDNKLNEIQNEFKRTDEKDFLI